MLYNYKNSYFFGSQYIKVFPCSYRGEYEKAGKKNSFDPEARLNTEYNFVNLPGFAGHTSYIKSYENNILSCVIGGYYFELELDQDNLGSDCLKNASLYINLYTFDLSDEYINETTSKKRKTTRLTSFIEATALDSELTVSDAFSTDPISESHYVFTGLLLSNGEKTGDVVRLKAFDADGQINKEVLLPMLYHGAGTNSLKLDATSVADGEGSVALGDHINTSKRYQTVVGKYNSDVPGEFIIGKGISSSRQNSFVANGDTISINKNLKIKNGTTIYTNISPDSISVKNNNTEIKDTTGNTTLVTIKHNEKIELNNIPDGKTTTQKLILSGEKSELNHTNKAGSSAIDSKITLTDNGIILETIPQAGGFNEGTKLTLTSGSDNYGTPIRTVDIKAEKLSVNDFITIGKEYNLDKTFRRNVLSFGDSDIDHIDHTKLDSSLGVTNNTTVGGTLTVGTEQDPKDTTLNGTLIVNSSTNAINANGATNLNGSLKIKDSATASTESLSLDSNELKVSKYTELTNGLAVATSETNSISLGKSNIEGNTNPAIKINPNGDIRINSDAYTNGKLYFGYLWDSANYISASSTGLNINFKNLTLAASNNGIVNVGSTTTATPLNVHGGLTTYGSNTIYGNIKAGKVKTSGTGANFPFELIAENSAKKIESSIKMPKATVESSLTIEDFSNNNKVKISNSNINFSTASGGIYGVTTFNTGCYGSAASTSPQLKYTNSKWTLQNSIESKDTIVLLDNNSSNENRTILRKLQIIGNSTTLLSLYKPNGNWTGIDGDSLFYVTSDGKVKAAGEIEGDSFNARSDRRLKENIVPFSSDKSILDLPVYRYDYISGSKNNIGCIAQELQEICPELVSENENGYLAVKESKLVYLLLEEIKKLNTRISKLEME